ncbi:Ppx/GppA family phosphatase [Actinomadura sp. DC4]|uniref:Ppx/GppA phosphatase family protein n=1 Tax=Actinomadura sp. DC4 TaxID=3055069 RepID=UPI0025B06862|nr:Ppx/GppA family phosphatase [Actinomadura sp. DC4]MDN3358749.1 Ppx/GppA family phosphatase [Actinomadura sp. DC4]
MRIGVLDVGSNSAHLRVLDLRSGDAPRPVTSVKCPTLLADAINGDGQLRPPAIDRLVAAVGTAACAARREHVDELIAFATATVRDAANREVVIARVAAETGVRLGHLTGRDEARLTFLAARDWYGWSAGPMLLMDIGGGSAEIAYGDGADPVLALSLPLGAGRLTREHLPGDPPRGRDVRRLRRHVYERLGAVRCEFSDLTAPRRVVATSKTFKQLARLTGAPKDDLHVNLDRLRERLPMLARADDRRRAKIKGVSKTRVHQILAGAIVAEALMTTFGVEEADVCPWALREGIAVQRMRTLPPLAVAAELTGLIQRSSGPRRLTAT